jgi:hypothetical protein
MDYTAQEKSDGLKKQLELLSNWRSSPQEILMRDTANFLRRNNISIFNKDGTYRGFEAIIGEVRSKFARNEIL